MPVSSRMLSFFILSILIHTLLIATLPDVSRFFNIPLLKMQLLPETEVEVTLIRPVRKPLPLPAAKSTTEKELGDEKKISTLIENRIAEIIALGDMPVPAPENIDRSRFFSYQGRDSCRNPSGFPAWTLRGHYCFDCLRVTDE